MCGSLGHSYARDCSPRHATLDCFVRQLRTPFAFEINVKWAVKCIRDLSLLKETK